MGHIHPRCYWPHLLSALVFSCPACHLSLAMLSLTTTATALQPYCTALRCTALHSPVHSRDSSMIHDHALHPRPASPHDPERASACKEQQPATRRPKDLAAVEGAPAILLRFAI